MAGHNGKGAAPGKRGPLRCRSEDYKRSKTTPNCKHSQIVRRAPDLDHEFGFATDNVTQLWAERFQKWGIPRRIIWGARHYLGVARITTTSHGLFEFHDDGDLAIIVPEGEPEVPGWAWVDDLIAFKPESPGHWWRRRGDVDLLGASNISPWRLSPVTIHETPLSWLRAGANGIVIINWGLDPIARLSGTGYLETETPALKRRLERRIQEVALASFDITVMEEVRHAA